MKRAVKSARYSRVLLLSLFGSSRFEQDVAPQEC